VNTTGKIVDIATINGLSVHSQSPAAVNSEVKYCRDLRT